MGRSPSYAVRSKVRGKKPTWPIIAAHIAANIFRSSSRSKSRPQIALICIRRFLVAIDSIRNSQPTCNLMPQYFSSSSASLQSVSGELFLTLRDLTFGGLVVMDLAIRQPYNHTWPAHSHLAPSCFANGTSFSSRIDIIYCAA